LISTHPKKRPNKLKKTPNPKNHNHPPIKKLKQAAILTAASPTTCTALSMPDACATPRWKSAWLPSAASAKQTKKRLSLRRKEPAAA
jgi:hypothetical protein